MAAMVAGAAFAADVSAKVKVDGSLFNYDDGTIKAFELHHSQETYNQIATLAFNGEKAGAEIRFFDGAADTNGTIKDSHWAVWFKPVDVLKMTVGKWGASLNQEQIDWCGSSSGCDSYGYAAEVSTNGISFAAALLPGNKNYFFTNDKSGTTLKESYIKAGYGADFGTVNAMVHFNNEADTSIMGVGFNSKAGPVSYFLNVLASDKQGKFSKIRAEPYFAFGKDALTIKGFIPVDYSLTAKSDACSVQTLLKVSYSLGSVTPFFYFNCGNVLAGDKIALEFKPGVDGSVGEMGYEVALDVKVASGKATFDVPVWFSVAF
jgi:hypothetical protein